MAPERIETGRLLLRRFTEEDRAEMVRFYGDPDVMAIRKYGKGYATEGAAAIRDIALNVLKLPVLVARSRGDNRGSHAVLEKIGMVFAERQESPGNPHGVVKYVLHRDSGS